MEIQTKKMKNNVVYNLQGDIDMYNSFVLRDIIETRTGQNGSNVTLDLAGVDFIDSNAVEVLLTCSNHIKQQHGSMKIVNLSESLVKDLNILKLFHAA